MKKIIIDGVEYKCTPTKEIVSIEPEQHFEVGDRVRRIGTNTKGDVITNIYESGGVTMYEFENSEDAPQSLSWELVDNSQRMVSAEAKEALLNDGEFTDFQKVLAELISIAQQSCLTPLQLAALHSETLMLEARKQIVSEIDVIALQKAGLVYQEGEQSAFFAGIDLVLKMIKGE